MKRFLISLVRALAAIVLAFIALLTFADVIARNAFNSPISSALELTEFGLAAITFLLYPLLALERRHLVVDLFDFATSERVKRLQDIVAGLVGIVVFGILAWRLWFIAERSRSYGDTTFALGLPLWPIFICMAVLSAVTAFAFLLSLHSSAQRRTDIE